MCMKIARSSADKNPLPAAPASEFGPIQAGLSCLEGVISRLGDAGSLGGNRMSTFRSGCRHGVCRERLMTSYLLPAARRPHPVGLLTTRRSSRTLYDWAPSEHARQHEIWFCESNTDFQHSRHEAIKAASQLITLLDYMYF